MNIENSLTIRDDSPERDNRWFSRTSAQQIEHHSDSITRNPNVIRFPVTSTIVRQSSSYVPLPQAQTTITTHTVPLSTTISTGGVQVGIGQSFNITSSQNNNVPASYVVGPPTVISSGPKELQGSFGTLPHPSLHVSSVKYEDVSTSANRPSSSTPYPNPSLNFYSTDPTTIQKIDHQKCINQCRNWQIKYNDLYSRYLGLSNERFSMNSNDSTQVHRLRQQNKRLQQRIAILQDNQKRVNQTVQMYIGDMINKYRQSTTREAGLLFDRFRLECRAMDKM